MSKPFNEDILSSAFRQVQQIHFGDRNEGALHNVEILAGSQNEIDSHPLFVELLELCTAADKDIGPWDSAYLWSEAARWIKFEETVEEGGNRWSKPHITKLNLPSLLQLKHCFKNGTTILDLEATTFEGICGIDLFLK